METLRVDWGLKARALLLDSPFAGVDPAGESERRAEIEKWLDIRGSGAGDGSNRGLLESAADDAYDAMSLLRLGDGRAPAVEQITPVHPLSAERSGSAFERSAASALWGRFWGKFSTDTGELPAIHDAVSYRRLFQAWSAAAFDSKERSLALLPTDALRPDCPVWSHRRLASAIAGARSFTNAAGERGHPALLYLHVGPVQSFITAARRTHDLWMGSFLLSFLVLQATKAIADLLGPDSIVYPDLATLPLARRVVFEEKLGPAEPGSDDDGRTKMLRASIANRVLAVVPVEAGDAVAGAAMKAVDTAWRDMAARVRARIHKEFEKRPRQDAPTREPWTSFDAQIAGHLEMDTVMLPWPETKDAAVTLFEGFPVSGQPLATWPDELRQHTGFGYGPLFNLTHRVLAAHRSTFDATPTPTAPPAAAPTEDVRPKCTQCGLREQMGPSTPDNTRGQHHISREFWTWVTENAKDAALQINVGEGLCAVCLTKRFAPEAYFGAGDRDGAKLGLQWSSGGGAHPDRALLRFPSTASIASAPFRKRAMGTEAARAWAARLDRLMGQDVLDFTPPGNLLLGLGGIGRENNVLNHDGSWLYEASYEPTVAWSDHRREIAGESTPAYRLFREQLPATLDAYQQMRRAAGAGPSAYYAVIQLDGDRMGEWLTGRHAGTPAVQEVLAGSGISIPKEANGPRPLFPALHGELSRRLALLAEQLHTIVNARLGRVVYSGGDDLLAFVPIATLLPCLREIRQAFRSEEHLGGRVTISAGIAIAHWHDPLGTTLRAAREAEADAKHNDRRPGESAGSKDRWGRNRLSFRLLKRSGEEMRITVPSWTLPFQESRSPAHELEATECLEELLGLLRGAAETKDESETLAGPAVAYKLQQELQMAGSLLDHEDPLFHCGQCHDAEPLTAEDQSLAEAFWSRIEVHLGMSDPEQRAKNARLGRVHAFLRAYWDELRARFCLPRAAKAFCDLLLFARFLLREGGAA